MAQNSPLTAVYEGPGSEDGTGPLKGWHVLLIFLAFFSVVFAVNGVFLHSAITSFPGEDVKKSYVQGLSYGDTLDRRARQAELGWQAGIGFTEQGIVMEVVDGNDAHIAGLVVDGELRRKVTSRDDRVLRFTSVGDGLYSADPGVLTAGEWHVTVRAYDTEAARDAAPQAPVFEARKTLYIP